MSLVHGKCTLTSQYLIFEALVRVGKKLTASLDLGMVVGLDADDFVTLFCSCCLEIFSLPSTFIAFAIILNSSNVKSDKLGAIN